MSGRVVVEVIGRWPGRRIHVLLEWIGWRREVGPRSGSAAGTGCESRNAVQTARPGRVGPTPTIQGIRRA